MTRLLDRLYCWWFGHHWHIPTGADIWAPIRCRRCGYAPVDQMMPPT